MDLVSGILFCVKRFLLDETISSLNFRRFMLFLSTCKMTILGA